MIHGDGLGKRRESRKGRGRSGAAAQRERARRETPLQLHTGHVAQAKSSKHVVGQVATQRADFLRSAQCELQRVILYIPLKSSSSKSPTVITRAVSA